MQCKQGINIWKSVLIPPLLLEKLCSVLRGCLWWHCSHCHGCVLCVCHQTADQSETVTSVTWPMRGQRRRWHSGDTSSHQWYIHGLPDVWPTLSHRSRPHNNEGHYDHTRVNWRIFCYGVTGWPLLHSTVMTWAGTWDDGGMVTRRTVRIIFYSDLTS